MRKVVTTRIGINWRINGNVGGAPSTKLIKRNAKKLKQKPIKLLIVDAKMMYDLLNGTLSIRYLFESKASIPLLVPSEK